jgi:DNA-binding Xre family transcriptional regulator
MLFNFLLYLFSILFSKIVFLSSIFFFIAVSLIIYKLTLLIQKFIQSKYLVKTNCFFEKNNKKIIYCLIIFLTLNMSLSTYLAFKNKTDIQNKIILLKQKSSKNEKLKNEANFSHSSGIDENNQDTSTNINVEKILIARFIDCQVGDLIHYIFEDSNGQQFDFSAMPDNYKLIDNNYKVNPEYKNKQFEIKWKAVPDSGGEDSYPYNEIITIELIE